jgi:hypothetical protein
MRLRVAGGALVAALRLLPAEASADHQIAEAVRASGKPLVTASGDQPVAGAELVAGLSSTPGSLELVGHSPLLNPA